LQKNPKNPYPILMGAGSDTGAARIRIPFPIIGKRKSPI